LLKPAIGRSQELATDGWCRRKAELPLLVELEKSACPHKYRMDLISPLFFFTEKPAWVP
jgi:hypothetical protein